MTDHIIKAAREADPAGEHGRLFYIAAVTPQTLERFYAIAYRAGLEDAAQVCESWGEWRDFPEKIRALMKETP